MDQLTLDMRPETKLQRDFRHFHEENPEVYDLVIHFAELVKAAGRERYSMDAILHRIRWHMDIDTRATDGFKLNNNHAAYYTRMLTEDRPDLGVLFTTRRVDGDPVTAPFPGAAGDPTTSRCMRVYATGSPAPRFAGIHDH